MKVSIPSVTPDVNGRFPCPYKKCADKKPFKNQSAFNMHYLRVHSKTIVVPKTKRHNNDSQNTNVTPRSNKCKKCHERVEFGHMRDHWLQAHPNLRLPIHLKYNKSYSQRKARQLAKAKTSAGETHVQPLENIRIFSYFCPACATPIAASLEETNCKVCRLPLSPIRMALNLAVKLMDKA